MRGLKIIPDDVNINFIRFRVLAFILSAALIFGTFGLLMTKGLNFGIDFTGGTVIEIRTPDMPDLEGLRKTLNDLELGAISIQEFGQPDDLLIRLPQQEESEEDIAAYEACLDERRSRASDPDAPVCKTVQVLAIEKVRATLDGVYQEAGDVEYRRVEYVGPQVGEELKMQGMMAITFSILGIMAYIWFRFEWQFAVSATFATTLHDVVLTVGLFSLTQMEFNLSTLAAILLVAGYSVNDTVVVFDRIRENLRKYKKKPLPELLNMSINEMLTRTMVTSVTTLLALIALYVFGGEVIRGFVYALIFGIVIGTYSSVFVASPLLIYLGVRPSKDKEAEDDAAAESAA